MRMTNKEAIEVLKANYPDACYSQLREAVNKAIEALKEMSPKKPIENKGNSITEFKCPRCRSIIAYKVDENFVFSASSENNICNCGQEIDWSEETSTSLT